jgi:nitrile hydratase subunit alpha
MSDVVERVRELESALARAGVVREAEIDAMIDLYADELAPRHGARLVARAWTDPTFRQRLLDDAGGLVRELGYDLGGATHEALDVLDLRAVANTPTVHNVIVCTLCSCYPLALLGVQPRWYKSPEYRARVVVEPRRVLAEFGLLVPDETEIRVWDSTAETRYMVVPQPPEGSDGRTAAELEVSVTRDSLIGVGLARPLPR